MVLNQSSLPYLPEFFSMCGIVHLSVVSPKVSSSTEGRNNTLHGNTLPVTPKVLVRIFEVDHFPEDNEKSLTGSCLQPRRHRDALFPTRTRDPSRSGWAPCWGPESRQSTRFCLVWSQESRNCFIAPISWIPSSVCLVVFRNYRKFP